MQNKRDKHMHAQIEEKEKKSMDLQSLCTESTRLRHHSGLHGCAAELVTAAANHMRVSITSASHLKTVQVITACGKSACMLIVVSLWSSMLTYAFMQRRFLKTTHTCVLTG